MSHELTRDEFLDHLAAFERRLVERLDLLERLIALGFDDATDQLRSGWGSPVGRQLMPPCALAETEGASQGCRPPAGPTDGP